MRIALIADTHLSSRVPECLGNWHAARAAVRRLGADLTINLGDVTFDGQHQPDNLALAGELVGHLWLPSTAYLLGDDMQARIGEKLVGLGVLDITDSDAAFDLWCPQGMLPHQVSELGLYRARTLERSRERFHLIGREAV